MNKSSGIVPRPLISIRKRDEADGGETAETNKKSNEGNVGKDSSEPSPFNNPQNEGRGCLSCYDVHERCSLRDTPAVTCQRCKQKFLKCIIFPVPNGPRDPEKGVTSPRTPKSKNRETEEVLNAPNLRPKGPRPRPETGKE